MLYGEIDAIAIVLVHDAIAIFIVAIPYIPTYFSLFLSAGL